MSDDGARIWGGRLLLVGSLGVVVTSALYGASPPETVMPGHGADLAAAAQGAIAAPRLMHLAGLLGAPSDVAVTAAALVLGTRALGRGGARTLGRDGICALRGDELAPAFGWFLIAISTILFTLVDSLVGFVLAPVAAAAGASPAFLLAKRIFDVLFLLGTASFGAGAVLCAHGLPRRLAIPAIVTGGAGVLGGVGGIFGLDPMPLLALALLGGSATFAAVGFHLGRAGPVSSR